MVASVETWMMSLFRGPPSRPPPKSSVQSEADIYHRWSQKLEGWIPDSVHPLFFFFPLNKSQDHPSSLLCSKHWSRFLTEATWAQITQDKSVSGFTPSFVFKTTALVARPGALVRGWKKSPRWHEETKACATRPWESLKSASLDKACLGTHWQQTTNNQQS